MFLNLTHNGPFLSSFNLDHIPVPISSDMGGEKEEKTGKEI